jgi:thiol-disulfide isomerase/thioredoxin
MVIPLTVKRGSFVLAAFLVFSGGIALLGWKLIQHRIALHAHAPHLVSVPELGVDLPFRTLQGEFKHLSELKGKVVFLDPWGTWCIQCVAEMPSVQTLYNHYRNDPNVVFLIVSRLDSPATVRRYA